MRHLIGVVLGIVATAALFFAGGWGVHRFSTVVPVVTNRPLTGTRAVSSLGALLGTGLLIGVLLAMPRVSPLAPALPGLAALAASTLYVADPGRVVRLMPMRASNFGLGVHLLLATGVYAVLGIAMIVPLFVPSRWRGYVPADDEPMGVAAASSYLS